MHDIRTIRADPAAFKAAMTRRGVAVDTIDMALEFDATRREKLTKLQELQARKNELVKLVGQGRRDGSDTALLEDEATALDDKIQKLETETKYDTARGILGAQPNILDGVVPDGSDERGNIVMSTHGEPQKIEDLSWTPKQHFELGEALGMMDFASASRISGSRFSVLRGPLARLERALGQMMLDLHTTEHGYTETAVPLLVNEKALYGTGHFGNWPDDLFRTTDDRFLIPTAEVPLTNLVGEGMVLENDLPIRMVSLSECFRSEAGAAGRDTRGLMRQHQFRKVELVSIVHPNESVAEHERMTQNAERVLTLLGLSFRRVLLCAGDTGFSAAKTYDLEVWLPGQQAWREISSCSNCRDFQARRMNARYKKADGKVGGFVHTLNGSGVAIGRALIAVMENYQTADGSIVVPHALRPYMGGQCDLEYQFISKKD